MDPSLTKKPSYDGRFVTNQILTKIEAGSGLEPLYQVLQTCA